MFEIIQVNSLWELCILQTNGTLLPTGIKDKQKRKLLDTVLQEIAIVFDKQFTNIPEELSALSTSTGAIHLSSVNGFVPNTWYHFYPVKGVEYVRTAIAT